MRIHSFVDISDESDIPVISDEHATAWEALYVPSIHSREDPNQAPTEVAPSTHVTREGEVPSIPETPNFEPDRGDQSPDEPAIGTATRVVAKERMTQTPPLLSRLIQGYLDHTGIEHAHIIKWTMESEIQIVIIAREPLVLFTTIRLQATDIYRFSPSTFQAHTHIG